jgi:hypothetical protein
LGRCGLRIFSVAGVADAETVHDRLARVSSRTFDLREITPINPDDRGMLLNKTRWISVFLESDALMASSYFQIADGRENFSRQVTYQIRELFRQRGARYPQHDIPGYTVYRDKEGA